MTRPQHETPARIALLDARRLQGFFAAVLLARLLYPFFNSPLQHLFSDPLRHWENGERFLHPTVMGSSDPYLYQLWLFLLQQATQRSAPGVLLGCGVLCAAMPYGWYRALRELLPKSRALAGALLIGLIPESVSIYAYFMNETLLLTLLGVCFWLTLRAQRKRTVGAFALAALVWLCAGFTRTIALPMAAGCLAWLWATQPQRLAKAFLGIALALAFAIPAGLHAHDRLGFFAPFGNLYFNEIYSAGGTREIAVNYGPDGAYHFGCPSFYNPAFYPWSNWTTDRNGVLSIAIDLTRGRTDWKAEKKRVNQQRTFPRWRQRWEDIQYIAFGQSWPNSDRGSLFGWLTLWTRWLWAPLIVWVGWAVWQRRYRGTAYLLPICGLGTLALLLMQSEGVMEARYREPIDAILVAAAVLIGARHKGIDPA
jgi:Dolichyl-phosphate-mannose-protein mannosyltransferase